MDGILDLHKTKATAAKTAEIPKNGIRGESTLAHDWILKEQKVLNGTFVNSGEIPDLGRR